MTRSSTRLLVSLLAGSLVLLAAKVVTDYNHSTDFSQYRTYSWLKVEAGDPLWPDRIMAAVDSELAAKGLTKAPIGDASYRGIRLYSYSTQTGNLLRQFRWRLVLARMG